MLNKNNLLAARQPGAAAAAAGWTGSGAWLTAIKDLEQPDPTGAWPDDGLATALSVDLLAASLNIIE